MGSAASGFCIVRRVPTHRLFVGVAAYDARTVYSLFQCVLALLVSCVWVNSLSAQTSIALASTRADHKPCSVAVQELRSECLNEPLGIDIRQPRLSWRLTPTDATQRGQRQTSYQVLVASDPALLEIGKADLWDSGVVPSNQSTHVVYDGQALEYGDQCFWRVRVADERGVVSSWSDFARWTMGPLVPGDWQGKWIGSDQEVEVLDDQVADVCAVADPWFRKKFSLLKLPKRAEVNVASVGYHELYVNGRKVSDSVLAPSVSDLRKRVRFVTYDITDQLASGENVVAIWLGTSWSIFPEYQTADKPAKPLVLAQVRVEDADENRQIYATDESWKTHASPNRLIGTWEFMNFGGELYDARLEQPGWCDIDFDDSHWSSATTYPLNLLLSAEAIEPNRRVRLIEPMAIEQVDDDEYRIDMGVNFSGWLEIDIKGQPGKRVDILSSELEHRSMTHSLRSAYIIGPSGTGTFRNRFNYHCGRWITVRGLDRRPFPDEIRGYLVRTDFKRVGKFSCSNERINRIYETCLWTFENLSLGGYVVDCPHRERMGYGGDAHATIGTAVNNYALEAFYYKWNQDWRDVQREDGFVPHTAPTIWGGGGPAWSGFCITLPWEVYRQYGDKRILEESFPVIERWLAYLESQSSDDKLMRYGRRGTPGVREWDFLGDWLWPSARGTNSHTVESLFFNNCYWIYNLDTAAGIADAIGRHETALMYRSRAAEVRVAVHDKFYNPEQKGYVNGDQAYLAIALLVNLPPEEVRPAVFDRLEREILEHKRGHIHAGITGGAMLFKLLMESGRDDLILSMVDTDEYPGWGNMLRQDATTIWESWDVREGSSGSKLHSSYLYAGAWPIAGVAGIRPDPSRGGFQNFIIEPAVFAGEPPEWFAASYESDYGTIECSERHAAGACHRTVTVPPNTLATVRLTASAVDRVTEGEQALESSVGVSVLSFDDGKIALELQPGRYSFRVDD